MSFASLPPFELLARVCRVNAYKWCDPFLAIPGSLRDTMSASQVCRHWRSVIISAPELWRVLIDPYHPCASWKELLLKRSEPLSIEFMDSCFSCEDGRRRYNTQLEMQSGMHMRLRKYVVQLQDGFGGETIPTSSSSLPSEPGSWPQLQHLDLSFDTGGFFQDYRAPDGSDPQCLPDHLPGLATPILQHLELAFCYMPNWYGLGSIGRTLTDLRIFCPPIPSRLCPDRWIEVIQGLPYLETLFFSNAIGIDCNHPISSDRFTLGVKTFMLNDALHACASFLNQINLSQECCWTSISCRRDAGLALTVGDDVTTVLFHVKRFLTQTAVDGPHLAISDYSILINADPLSLSNHLRSESLPVITSYSHKFSIKFDPFDAAIIAIVYPRLLDLVRSLSSTIEIIESRVFEDLLPDNLNLFFEFLVQCQNIRFMLGVTCSWWKRLYRCLLPAVDDATNETTEPLFPKLRMIDFSDNTYDRQDPQGPDFVSFDDLKALCKHRASIGVPLERIDMHMGVLEIDSSGDIKSELGSWNWASEEGAEDHEDGDTGQ